MKISIEEVNRLLAFTPSERKTNRPASSAQAVVSTGVLDSRDAATVDVSTTAQEIQQVKKIVNALPDVRQSRVDALKAQIESGNYNVSGEDIADLMIRRALVDNTSL